MPMVLSLHAKSAEQQLMQYEGRGWLMRSFSMGRYAWFAAVSVHEPQPMTQHVCGVARLVSRCKASVVSSSLDTTLIQLHLRGRTKSQTCGHLLDCHLCHHHDDSQAACLRFPGLSCSLLSASCLPAQVTPEKKFCKHCSIEKPGTAFPKCSITPDGLHTYCRECKSFLDKAAKARKRHPPQEPAAEASLMTANGASLRMDQVTFIGTHSCLALSLFTCTIEARAKSLPFVDHVLKASYIMRAHVSHENAAAPQYISREIQLRLRCQ